jgi:hypothetical protein
MGPHKLLPCWVGDGAKGVRAIRPLGQFSHSGACGPWGTHSTAELQRQGPWGCNATETGGKTWGGGGDPKHQNFFLEKINSFSFAFFFYALGVLWRCNCF